MEIIIENLFIRLRSASMQDANELFAVSTDEDVMKYYGIEPYKNIKEAEDEIKWFLSLTEEGQGVRWVIADLTTNQYVGDIGLFHYHSRHNRVEIGFKLKKEYWNKGIMTACINKALDYGFLNQNYNRIEALVDTRNLGCKRTLQKCGFLFEGVLRDYEFEREGYVDLEMYSILRNDYNK
ncbi:GNAT family N-acetyltransferase [Brevibacillus brevis]|uniref:GNAT family N-acetyltransferase n=1 Tax=Brevibacillus brevis TaxID=1393 RepID=A0A517I598_BREBE|nr:GNAT family protein [Brevibacillus brevis]QDS34071.1 GNAT family N-acetyltransferase [Brevibacillus brevis]